MIFNPCKKFYFIFLATVFFASSLFGKPENYNYPICAINLGLSNPNHTKFNNDSIINGSTIHDKFGIRSGGNSFNRPHSYHGSGQYLYEVLTTQAEFKKIFQQAFDGAAQQEYLCNVNNFAFDDFRNYARTLPCYNDFMLQLQEKIKGDKSFRKATEIVPGFKHSFSVWSEVKSGFHDFVNTEALKIKKDR